MRSDFSGELRAEILRHRSVRVDLHLVLGMAILVLFVVLLHAASLPEADISGGREQLENVFGWAQLLGTLFAGLAGVLSVTAEYRFGTILPTMLASPTRWRVVGAKAAVGTIAGILLGLLAAGLALAAGSSVLTARGLDLSMDSGDYVSLVAGTAVAAALWGAIGVGLGAIVRDQVPAVVGLCAWLLFVETILLGDAGIIGDAGRFTPGGLARAASGQEASLGPAVAALALIAYAAVLVGAGGLAMSRRDVP